VTSDDDHGTWDKVKAKNPPVDFAHHDAMSAREEMAQGNVNDKRTLYVGGLEESVTKETIAAAFRPFGELTDVNLPMDAASSKHKGFAFVQFDDKADAAEAMDNMHNAELFGRVLRVNLAKPDAIKGGHRPVWESQADEFFNKEGAIGGEAPEGDDRVREVVGA